MVACRDSTWAEAALVTTDLSMVPIFSPTRFSTLFRVYSHKVTAAMHTATVASETGAEVTGTKHGPTDEGTNSICHAQNPP